MPLPKQPVPQQTTRNTPWRWLLALAVVVLPATRAQDQQAGQNLFTEASFYLRSQYNGFSSANIEALINRLQTELDKACTSTCGFNIGSNFVYRLLAGINDEHTIYFSHQQYQNLNRRIDGGGENAKGFGLVMSNIPASSDLLIEEVIEGSVADLAGLRRGDRVTAIDGRPPANEIALERPVVFVILRNQRERLSIKLQAKPLAVLRLPSLKLGAAGLLPTGLGLLRIPDFDGFGQVANRVHELVAEAKSKNLRGLVIDLRNNGGGVVGECLAAASAFRDDVVRLRQQRLTLFEERYSNGLVTLKRLEPSENRSVTQLKINKPSKWTGPVVVLVNASTASCGEYFSSELQFAARATVIGEPTAGLGNTAAQVFPLIDGGALQITTIKTLRPNGTPYPIRVIPNIQLNESLSTLARTGHDSLIDKAAEVLGAIK
jgi:carboxyl-terminal processing protease